MNWNVSKKVLTSSDAVIHLLGRLEYRICMFSCVDLILYLFGIYGTIILLRIFDMRYTGVNNGSKSDNIEKIDKQEVEEFNVKESQSTL